MHLSLVLQWAVQKRAVSDPPRPSKAAWQTNPHVFLASKRCGGVYFMWSGEIFLRNFLSYPPKKKSRVKGGDILGYCYLMSSIIFTTGKLISRRLRDTRDTAEARTRAGIGSVCTSSDRRTRKLEKARHG